MEQKQAAVVGQVERTVRPGATSTHVAWCRYVKKHEQPTRIVLCDSDAPGAFQVFRLGEAFSAARICAESHASRADDCGDLARKMLAALSDEMA